MTKEDQIVTIAEIEGWKIEWTSVGPVLSCSGRISKRIVWEEGRENTLKDYIHLLPDYLGDLNDIHAVILKLKEKDTEFGAALIEVLTLDHKHDFGVWKHATIARIAGAEASELSKAVLKAFEKWK